MKFHSKKGLILPFFVVLIILYLIWSYFNYNDKQKEYWFLFVVSIICLLVSLWVFFQAYYTLTEKKLKYKCGPISGEVEIIKIHTILKGGTFYWGIKYGLSVEGIIIKYGKYDDIFISPKSEEDFLHEILRINPKIIIENQSDTSRVDKEN